MISEQARSAEAKPFASRARNGFGRHLTPDCTRRLNAVLRNPTQRTWDNAYTIIIQPKGLMTLWQAWLAVDPLAVRSKPADAPWPHIPAQHTLYRALHHAFTAE